MRSVEQVATQSKGNGCLIGIGVIVVVVASFAHVITTSEAVPGRAKFVYDRNLRIVIPCPEPGQLAFYPVPGKFTNVRNAVNIGWDGVATWEEIRKKDGAFVDYTLPKGKGWDDFVFYGKPIPLWKDVLFRPQSRWDEEGYWRY